MQPTVRPVQPTQAGQPLITTETIQQYLEDNQRLIQTVLEHMNAGKLNACSQYQQRLQQNLMYLAAIADAQPPPPAQGAGASLAPAPQPPGAGASTSTFSTAVRQQHIPGQPAP